MKISSHMALKPSHEGTLVDVSDRPIALHHVEFKVLTRTSSGENTTLISIEDGEGDGER